MPDVENNRTIRIQREGDHDAANTRYWSESEGKWVVDYLLATAYPFEVALQKAREMNVVYGYIVDTSGFYVGNLAGLNVPTCQTCGQFRPPEDSRGLPTIDREGHPLR